MTAGKSIACAVDESSGSNAARAAAARLARELNTELVLVHVDAEPTAAALSAPPPTRRILAHQDQVERWSAAASHLRGEPVRVQPATGDAADEIVAFARRIRFDLLVVGSRARSPMSLALGSVTAKVLVRAPCPVLVVSPHQGEEER